MRFGIIWSVFVFIRRRAAFKGYLVLPLNSADESFPRWEDSSGRKCYRSENLRRNFRNVSDNMPYYSNVIQYQGLTDQKLVLDLTQPEDYLRSLIEDFVRCGYGVQLQRGSYWLSFTDKDNAVQWIDPHLPIKEAFVHARRTLNGRAIVTLKVVQLFLKVEKSEFYFSDFK